MLNKLSDHLVILVATYNRLELLKKAIDSIASGTRCPHEIVVIDGGSTDGTIEFLRAHPGITAVFQGKLIGQARACNEVWRQIESQYTCWLSDDTEVENGSLDLAVDILEKHPGIGMVGLKMIDTMGPGAGKPYRGARSQYGILNCNHGVLSMSLLRSVGFFNEDYHSYTIDPDLVASVLCTGRSVVLTKRISVFHHRADAETDEYQERKKSQSSKNREIYDRKFKFLADSVYLTTGWQARLRQKMVKDLYFRSARISAMLGLNIKDQYNLLGARFIQPTDPVTHFFHHYYMEQRIPRKLLLLPSNPYRHLVG